MESGQDGRTDHPGLSKDGGSGTSVGQGQKNAGMYGEKHLARVQARIRAAGDHLVEITSASEWGAVAKGARA